jgi:hypothetical protein
MCPFEGYTGRTARAFRRIPNFFLRPDMNVRGRPNVYPCTAGILVGTGGTG